MWRTLLICWFVVNALFGQGVCCCAFLCSLPTRLLSSSNSGCAPEQTTPVQPTPRCCGTHHNAETSWRPSTGNPSGRPCPCRVNPSRAMISTSPEAERTALRKLSPTGLAEGLASSLLLAPLFSPPPGATVFARAPRLPFHPTSELLRAFHLLRC